MLVVDAGTLFEVVADTPFRAVIEARIEGEAELVAPHIVDVEVLGVIRRHFLLGNLDNTAARLAVRALRRWPGERFGHQDLLARAWELRSNVRGWDAMYVALAEAMGATLITSDEHLSRVSGLHCPVEYISVH